MSPNISEKQKAGNDQKLCPKLFLIDVFQRPATRGSVRSLKDAKRCHYMQMLFIVSQAAQILPWSGCRSPQLLPSEVYAQGFLISSQRAAAIAAAFTTAAGWLSANSEASICCPGGSERRSGGARVASVDARAHARAEQPLLGRRGRKISQRGRSAVRRGLSNRAA